MVRRRSITDSAFMRLAKSFDIAAMQAIERAARLFAEIGMHDIAAHEPLPADVLQQYIDNNRAWVAEILMAWPPATRWQTSWTAPATWSRCPST